ncbi:MAG: peptidylprolyl isomerase [Bacteroidota bacterium]
MKNLTKCYAIILFLFLFPFMAKAQQNSEKVLIDQVVAVVGSNVILYSEIENEFIQMQLQGSTKGSSTKCNILEELMFQKLMLTQSEIDSVKVTDKQVDSELDRRLRYFISQVGSKEKLEEYFKKSILEIKEDMREKIREYLLIQNVQSKITQDIKITPSEVTDFFRTIPSDSLPLIGSQIEIEQIVKQPVISNVEIDMVKDKLNSIRARVLKGEDFAILANLYSEDPGSMTKGGELGFVGRGELYPEFEAAAFSLKLGDVSPIVKTEKGYHIIQLIERRGEYINVRHILIIPKASPIDLAKSRKDLENIMALISMDTLTFEQAAARYSDDPTKVNGGKLINPYTGDSKFSPEEVEPNLFFIVEKMNVGDKSAPMLFTNDDGQQAYRIVYLKSRTEPHKANLKDDYPQIQNMALTIKQNQAINKWVVEKSKNTFVKITNDFKSCDFKYDWISY